MPTDHPDPSPTRKRKPQEGAPSYDPSKEHYAGISSAGLESLEDLRAARDFAEMIVDTVREGLLVLDLDLRVQAANESFYDTFQVRPEETLGRLVYELGGAQWNIPELHELLEDILPEKKVMGDYEVEHDFPGIGRRVMLLNARQLDDHQLILLAIEDVTERQERAAALHESEARFRAVADLVPDLLWQSDSSGERTWGNQRWMEYTGQTLEEAVGYGWADTIHPDDRDRALRAYREAARAGESFRDEHRLRRADGVYRWFLVGAVPVRDNSGRITQWFGAATDVHDQRTAMETLEERVEERTRQVRHLARRLTMAEQQERRRISRILHDDLQQMLYGMQMKISLLQKEAESGDREPLAEETAKLNELFGRAITTTRQLTVDLSPPVLKGEGLADALAWLRMHVQELYGLDVELQAAHAFYIEEEDLRVLLFQIVRELLFNVVKHAGTDRATVALRDGEEEGHLVIEVVDRGKGFDVETADGDREGSFGLFSVHERLQLIGGRMEVDSAPGAGTRVVVHAPVAPEMPRKASNPEADLS